MDENDCAVVLEIHDGEVQHLRPMDGDEFISCPREGDYIRPGLPADDVIWKSEQFNKLRGMLRVVAIVHDLKETRLIVICEFGAPSHSLK